MDDLCLEPNLTEESLLADLRLRFEEELIYTYVGNILVSVNPFKFFPIYNPQYCIKYQNRRLGDPLVRPHIFAVADAAFHALVQNAINQCVVISGESGSGKTEATKMLMYHIMRLSCKQSTGGDLNKILGTAPVLEAFGNARTVSNNNSSRFGKFLLLQFMTSGAYREASIEKYLLEKSRVISQSPEERNYHIFYFLLAGARQQLKDRLRLKQPKDYNYLNKTLPGVEKCYQVPAIDDKEEFKKLCKSLTDVKFTSKTQEEVFELIAAILHLGNVEFSAGENGESSVKDKDTLSFVGKLLKVEEGTLSLSLTQRKSVIRGAEFTTPFQVNESIDARDATSKALYSYLFDWIVAKVNNVLSGKQTTSKMLSIGLLDIFGFENFKVNSFEQFCINYANEQLQQYFNRHIFSYEQQVYKADGIEWAEVGFTDNTPCLELISKRPTGILHLLDEESKLSTGGDDKLLEKIAHHYKDSKYFVIPRKTKNSVPAFTIKHYAGAVMYTIGGFRDKNRDLMRPDVIAVLQGSTSSFIQRLIGEKSVSWRRWRSVFHVATATHYLANQPKVLRRRSTSTEETSSKQPTKQRRKSQKKKQPKKTSLCPQNEAEQEQMRTASRRGSAAASLNPSQFRKSKVVTVGGNFMASLSSLMANLSVAEPYFVRCIKSNPNQKAMVFDDKKVMEQLHYLGMVDTIKVRRMGYALRYEHEEFLTQIRLIVPPEIDTSLPAKERILSILKFWNVEKRIAQVGTSKVFLRTELRDRLTQQTNDALLKHVLVLQNRARFVLARRHFLAVRRSIILIQTSWRNLLDRRARSKNMAAKQHMLMSAIRLQCIARGFLARKRVEKLREALREEKQVARTKRAGTAAFAAAATAAAVRQSRVELEAAQKQRTKVHAEAVVAAAIAKAAAQEQAKAKAQADSQEARVDVTASKSAGVEAAGGQDAVATKENVDPADGKSPAAETTTTPAVEPKLGSMLKESWMDADATGATKKSYYRRLVSTQDKKHVKQEGHVFQISIFNLPTMCEHCKEPVVPRLVEGGVCESCHFAVHQKCISKISKPCKVSKDSSGNMVWQGTVFGASLTQLMSLHDVPVPILLERCFEQIEARGRSTLDIYKNIPLNQTKLKALKKQLGEYPVETDISQTDIPILCGIVKLFFRELPDPVVPYHMYRDFINTSAVSDVQEQCREMHELIDILPDSHRFAIKRLIRHLADIANHLGVTQTAHSLAAVFAPLVLSTPKTVKAAEGLKHVKLRLRLLENLIITVAEDPDYLAADNADYDSDDSDTGSGFVSPALSTISCVPGRFSSTSLATALQPGTGCHPPSPVFVWSDKSLQSSEQSPSPTASDQVMPSDSVTSTKSVSQLRGAFLSQAKGRVSQEENAEGVSPATSLSSLANVKPSDSRSRVADLSGKFSQAPAEKPAVRQSTSSHSKPLGSIAGKEEQSPACQKKPLGSIVGKEEQTPACQQPKEPVGEVAQPSSSSSPTSSSSQQPASKGENSSAVASLSERFEKAVSTSARADNPPEPMKLEESDSGPSMSASSIAERLERMEARSAAASSSRIARRSGSISQSGGLAGLTGKFEKPSSDIGGAGISQSSGLAELAEKFEKASADSSCTSQSSGLAELTGKFEKASADKNVTSDKFKEKVAAALVTGEPPKTTGISVSVSSSDVFLDDAAPSSPTIPTAGTKDTAFSATSSEGTAFSATSSEGTASASTSTSAKDSSTLTSSPDLSPEKSNVKTDSSNQTSPIATKKSDTRLKAFASQVHAAVILRRSSAENVASCPGTPYEATPEGSPLASPTPKSRQDSEEDGLTTPSQTSKKMSLGGVSPSAIVKALKGRSKSPGTSPQLSPCVTPRRSSETMPESGASTRRSSSTEDTRQGSGDSLDKASSEESMESSANKNGKAAKKKKSKEEIDFNIPEVQAVTRLSNVTRQRAANRGRRPPTRRHMQSMSEMPTIPDSLVCSTTMSEELSGDEG